MNEKKVSVGVGIAVLFVLVALVSASSVIYASQEAGVYVKSDLPAAQSTNETQQEEAEDVEKPVRYMFVQSVQSGSFVQVEGEDNLYTLTLEGVAPQTIAFSDRPECVMGQVPMQKFLDGLCFSTENPPNACLLCYSLYLLRY